MNFQLIFYPIKSSTCEEINKHASPKKHNNISNLAAYLPTILQLVEVGTRGGIWDLKKISIQILFFDLMIDFDFWLKSLAIRVPQTFFRLRDFIISFETIDLIVTRQLIHSQDWSQHLIRKEGWRALFTITNNNKIIWFSVLYYSYCHFRLDFCYYFNPFFLLELKMNKKFKN